MNNASPRSADTPPNVEPSTPDSHGKHNRPDPEGEPLDPQQHPLVELPPRTEPEIPAKPQRDLPHADPERADDAGADVSSEDTIPAGLPDAELAHQPWQAPNSRSPWMTQPLKAMPLPIPTMPLPFAVMPR